ncbi:cartilage intermediate layer protein 2-like [Mercenaria mercenaria]|uniref:cartilage intermediate layer protein 2-like n=1 Tax=Mercenaria mercenaria TaxID=6596 RepID=UPI001E1DEC9B|nr:cartilage intermediate layer protein 2-like [Mercenaria mercenaria]
MRLETVLFALAMATLTTVTEGHPRFTWWQNFLCSHWYKLPWIQNGITPEPTERISQIRTLVRSCRADVGTCPVGSCSTKTKYFNFCPEDGYVCPESETRTADCGFFGERTYEYVKQCGCCKDNGVFVTGVVKDADTNEPLSKIIVYFDGRFVVYTGEDGQFKSTIKSSVRSIVVTTNDTSRNYMSAVKIVDIPEGFRGPVEVELLAIQKSKPVEINSTVDTVLSLSNDPLDPSAGNTVIEIQANSFTDPQGRSYNGKVNARVTFIDTAGNPDAVAPGRFQTLDGDTIEPLITDGVASFNFESTGGKVITLSAPVKFTGRKGMKVWELNTRTGLWEPARVVQGRRKRQVTLDDIINIESDRWYNIDKIPGAPRCYFKGRIFSETSGDEIMSSATTSFRPEIAAYTSIGQRLRLYAGFTSEPNTTCYEVRCPVVSNPNSSLAGFINMSATEVILFGGINLPSKTYLTPREFIDYDAVIKPKLSSVQYEIAPNNLDVFVNFVSDNAGPFYGNRNACESSSVTQPALHFLKPEPPNYEPAPDVDKICTARIAFKGGYFFYYALNLTNLPNVTGISVWEQNGTKSYFIDDAQMEFSTDGNETFIFICLKYRCSQENESTTVYLDIDISTVNVTYFGCYGDSAEGSEFSGQEGGDNVTTIEGSFVAPFVASGPDFYDSETNVCRQESDHETFAYVFYCYSYYEYEYYL